MTMLSTPTRVDQLTAGGPLPHSSCAAACVRSEAIDLGKSALTEAKIVAAIGVTSAGTTTTKTAAGCKSLGIPATAVASTGEVDAALARKHRIMVEIPSDHYGNPSFGSALGHFILVYGFDGANYHFMNPLGGRLVGISAAGPKECERERGLRALEFGVVTLADSGHPAPAPAPAPRPAPAQGIIWERFSARVQVGVANIRSGPSTAFHVERQVRTGVTLTLDGYCYGPAVWDSTAHQMDRRWYHLAATSGYGWIASALVAGNAPGSHA